VAVISEIAPDIFRISIFAQLGNLQFSGEDDEPLLFQECTWRSAKPYQSSSTFPSCATSASAISSQMSAARSMSRWLLPLMPM
jgi:hypothetical protein